MPRFQVTVADEAGAKLYDETIEAPTPLEACAKAVADARVAADAAGAAPGGVGETPADGGAIG